MVKSSIFDALVEVGVSDLPKLSCERARLMAVLIPLAKGDAIKANLCRALRPTLLGDGDQEPFVGIMAIVT